MECVLQPAFVLKNRRIRVRNCRCSIIDFTPIKGVPCRLEALTAACISRRMFPPHNETPVADKSERRRFLRQWAGNSMTTLCQTTDWPKKRYRPKVAAMPAVCRRPNLSTDSAAVVDLAVTQLMSQRRQTYCELRYAGFLPGTLDQQFSLSKHVSKTDVGPNGRAGRTV
jgi:hypothetical protein